MTKNPAGWPGSRARLVAVDDRREPLSEPSGLRLFVTFVIGYFARDLDFTFFGWPFSFWVAAQGALIVYVIIIGFYARYMNRLDQSYGVAEEE